MTDAGKIASILAPLSTLNAWARLPYSDRLDMTDMSTRIYDWKRSVIAASIKIGIVQLRIVAVERSCKTCKGTGQYHWQNWYDEYDSHYEDCRRCGATGRVTLRFVESDIFGVKWHTPRPKWDLGIFAEDAWERIAQDTDWEPEQPGRVLDRVEFIRLVNQVEEIILEGRRPEPRMGRASDYSLHLGTVPGCWICGSINVRHDGAIYRPAASVVWNAGLCEDCWKIDAWTSVEATWPITLHRPNERDVCPPWHDRVPLPPLASDPAVLEWMARRQIFPGRYPPGELAWTTNGDMVRVLSATPADYRVEVLDRWGHNGSINGRPCREHIGFWNDAEITVRELRSTGRNPYVPEFGWDEVDAWSHT